MDGSALEEAMIAALQRLRGGVPLRLDADSFFNEKASDLEWLPPYLFAVNEEVWAIEIVRNDQLSEETAKEMQRASQEVPGLHSAVFIPAGEMFQEARVTAQAFGLAMIVEAERGHVVSWLQLQPKRPLRFPSAPAEYRPDYVRPCGHYREWNPVSGRCSHGSRRSTKRFEQEAEMRSLRRSC